MKNIPKKIYLQMGEDVEESDVFSDLSDITWCSDNLSSTDIAYVLEEAQQPQQIETYQALEKAVREYREAELINNGELQCSLHKWNLRGEYLANARAAVDRILKQLEAEAGEPAINKSTNVHP